MTRAHQSLFEAFGFAVMPQLFAAEGIATISRAFDEVMLAERDGQPFAGRERQVVTDWFRRHPDVGYLEKDPRILAPIKDLLGNDAALEDGNDGNYYVGDTGWHPDLGWDAAIPGGENDPYRLAGNLTRHYCPSIKVAFYLDPVDRHSGCLRVIPGSHRNPLHDKLWSLHLDIPARASKLEHVGPKLEQMWRQATGSDDGSEILLADPDFNHFHLPPAEVPCCALESNPGDVVFFSHQLWHASFGGRSGRRMFTLNFMSSPN